MSIADTIEAMAKAGAPIEAILLAVRAIEEARATPRSANTERQARFRAREKNREYRAGGSPMSFRRQIASYLAFASMKVAPPVMRPIFWCYLSMLDLFNEQVAMGRTFGVITASWAQSLEDLRAASIMESAAIVALAAARRDLEKASSGGGKGGAGA